jgi:lipoprotein-releasing system permease protein
MSWPLYLALKQLFPSGRRFPFFTIISVLGVGLGVMLMIMSVGVMGGAGWQIRQLIRETQGDVQVRAQDGLVHNLPAAQAAVRAVAGVEASTPVAFGKVMLQVGNRVVFPDVVGYEPDTLAAVCPRLAAYMTMGSLDALDDDAIVLSYGVAAQLDIGVGDNVTVYSPVILERLQQDAMQLPVELRVVGLYEAGHQQFDKDLALATMRRVQDLYALGEAAHGLNLRLAPGYEADDTAARINLALSARRLPLRAQSWQELNAEFLNVLQFEKYMIFFLLTFIVIVSAFSVTSSLLIAVVRKTREIGLLASLGGSPAQVAACFCFQGLLIGLAGTIAGVIAGFSGLALRAQIVNAIAWCVDLFSRHPGTRAGMEAAYGFASIPVHVAPHDLIVIIVGTVLISALAGLIPAWRAARLKPVEALRSE